MDDNLKLKLIERAHNTQVEHFNRKKFLKEVGWSEEKISDSERPSDEIRAYFLSLELPVLDHLEGLWVSSMDHYKWKIFPSWDGEDDYFAIKSLQGISTICPNLKILNIDHLDTGNLSPLLKLEGLEEIVIDYCDNIIDPNIFRQFDNLKKLSIGCPYGNKSEWDKLELDLKAKEIKVELDLWSAETK